MTPCHALLDRPKQASTDDDVRLRNAHPSIRTTDQNSSSDGPSHEQRTKVICPRWTELDRWTDGRKSVRRGLDSRAIRSHLRDIFLRKLDVLEILDGSWGAPLLKRGPWHESLRYRYITQFAEPYAPVIDNKLSYGMHEVGEGSWKKREIGFF